MTVAELAAILDGAVSGCGSERIGAVASLQEARSGDLSFLKERRYARHLATTAATAVLVPMDWEGESSAAALIRVADPDAACMQAAALLAPPALVRRPGIHPTAVIAADVVLGEEVHIGPWTVIEEGAVIGDRSIIEAQVFIGQQVRLGADCHIYPQVTIREGSVLGARVILHSGVRIGGDGYGYTPSVAQDGTIAIEKIAQLGIVELGDDVEVGSNTTIDRARLGRTRIGDSTKIDNLVQIGHNVQVGAASGIIAQAGVAGSTRIGSGCLIWAQAGLSGHLNIGDRAQVGPKSGLSKDVPPGEYYLGLPALPKREFAATLLTTRQVAKLKERVVALERQLAALAPSQDS